MEKKPYLPHISYTQNGEEAIPPTYKLHADKLTTLPDVAITARTAHANNRHNGKHAVLTIVYLLYLLYCTYCDPNYTYCNCTKYN